MSAFCRVEDILARAQSARAFSAVSAEIGNSNAPVWTYAHGTLGFTPDAANVDRSTIFDLASLTKVLATTTIALELVDTGRLSLETPIGHSCVRDVLEHASGLPAYREYFREMVGRDAYAAAIAAEPLEYEPRTKSIYSDLGFIILGFTLEDLGGASLRTQFQQWRKSAGAIESIDYLPPTTWHARTAMTEDDPWRGRILQGEVHDENTAALGGVAAHAGLFGTAGAVGEIARWWMNRLERNDAAAHEFTRRSTVPGSSRALGWDTMLPTSSCGARMSPRAIGHTGFTGTSLWIDPERNLYFVLLTNRVHPTRTNDAIQQVRREFHDAALTDL